MIHINMLHRCCFIVDLWCGTIMAQYLRFFTTVGDDQPTQWEEEELHVNSEELSQATGQYPTTLTFRDSLKRLYCSERFQVQCFRMSIYTKMLSLVGVVMSLKFHH